MLAQFKNRIRAQKLGFFICGVSASLIIISVVGIVGLIIIRGLPVISWRFISQMPQRGMTEGGIFPAILGTFLLGIGAIIFALMIGLITAIYLSEFASQGVLTNAIRTVTNTLAGMPSIVFGLFGFAFFCKLAGFGVSLLSGILTLGVLSLPIIISTSEEALKSVPDTFREASLSLGATKWYTVRKIVLPNAIPGIVTGSILALGRAMGETAPIMFTAATFYTRKLPSSILDEVMALPYHIYGLVTEGIYPEKQLPIAFGSAFVLLVLTLLISGAGIILRLRVRARRKW